MLTSMSTRRGVFALGRAGAPVNDFLKTQHELEAPLRRGALSAAAILRHVGEEAFRQLEKDWGARAIRAQEFVRLLRPIVIDAGYFTDDGSRDEESWRLEGWLGESLQRTRRRHEIPGVVAEESVHMDDASAYLLDVFEAIRPRGSTDDDDVARLAWETFTMYLVEGISDLNAAGVSRHDAGALRYDFRGELVVSFLGPSDTSREWFSKLRYIPTYDMLLATSRSRVKLLQCGKGNEEINIEAPFGATITTADFVEPRSLCVAATFQHELIGWYIAKGRPKEVFRLPPPLLDPNTVVSAMTVTGSRLWCGARDGSVVSTLVGQRGSSKFFFADSKLRKPHTDAVTSILAIPHNTTIVTSSLDKTLYVFDAHGGVGRDKETQVRGHHYGVLTLDFSTNSSVLLSGGFESRVLAWADNLWTSPMFTLADPTHPLDTVIGIKSIPSTPYVAVADSKGLLKIFDLRKRLVVQALDIADPEHFDSGLIRRDHLRRQADMADAAGAAANNAAAASVAASSAAAVAATTTVAQNLSSAAYFSGFEYTGSQHRELVFGGSRLFRFGMATDNHENPLLTYDADRGIQGAFGLDDAVLTVSDYEFTLWSAHSGVPDMRRRLPSASAGVVTMCRIIDPGDILLVGHEDGRFATYHVATGLPLREVRGGHDCAILQVAINPADPESVCSASEDRRICFWRLRLTEADNANAYDQRARLTPLQTVVLKDERLATVDFVGTAGAVLAIVCSSRIAVWTYYAEFRRWVHSYDIPVGLAPTPTPVTGTLLGGGGIGRASGQMSLAASPTAASTSAAKKTKARAALLKTAPAPRETPLAAAIPGLASGADVVVAAAFSMHARHRYPTERLLCLVTDEGLVKVWAVNMLTGDTAFYGKAKAPSVAKRLVGGASTASPKLHCVSFAPGRPHLLLTGDDLGRLTTWVLGEEATPPPRSSGVTMPSWANGGNTSRVEELATRSVHTDAVIAAEYISAPIDGVVSYARDHLVVVSTWDGIQLVTLQQGPLVARVWALPQHRASAIAYSWLSMQAKLRWQRLRDLYHTHRLEELAQVVHTPSTTRGRGRTAPGNPLLTVGDDDFADSLTASVPVLALEFPGADDDQSPLLLRQRGASVAASPSSLALTVGGLGDQANTPSAASSAFALSLRSPQPAALRGRHREQRRLTRAQPRRTPQSAFAGELVARSPSIAADGAIPARPHIRPHRGRGIGAAAATTTAVLHPQGARE
jgi:WD40 repeat protein